MFRIASSWAIVALFLASANAQMLIPLYGACSSSVQCVGVAICFNHVCQCPPIYNAVGITCVYAGLDGEVLGAPPPPIGPGPPPFPGPPPPGPPFPVGAAPPVAPSLPVAAGAPFAYPGLPCSAGKSCIGNSVCVQGTCGCPAGQVVAGYSCVAPHRVLPGGPPVPGPAPYAPVPRPPLSGAPYFPGGPIPGEDDLEFLFRGFPPQGPPPHGAPMGGPYPGLPAGPPPPTCPPAQVPLGPECFPPASIVNYPSPVPCQPAAPAPCIGGASCVASVCACPAPFIWAGTACVPPPPHALPPPPPPPAPLPVPAVPYHPSHFVAAPYPGPAPVQVAVRPAVLPAGPVPGPGPVPAALALGSACSAHNQCVVGAFCQLGVCQCRPAFLPYGSICVLRRRAKDEVERSHTEKSEKKKQ